MAIHQLWYGGPSSVRNADYAILPNVPVTAGMLLGPPVQRGAAFPGLTRVVAFGSDQDIALRQYMTNPPFPIVALDEFAVLAIPKMTRISSLVWTIENPVPGGQFDIRVPELGGGTVLATNISTAVAASGYVDFATPLYFPANDIVYIDWDTLPTGGAFKELRITLAFESTDYGTGQF